MKKLMAIVVSALCAAVAFGSTVSIVPGDDIAAKFAMVASGDTVAFAAGSYDIAEAIVLKDLENVTVCGAGAGKTDLYTSANGYQDVRFAWSGMRGLTVRDISFHDFVNAKDAEKVILTGGVFSLAQCDGVTFENCTFADNFVSCRYLPLTTTSSADTGALGGAVAMTGCVNATFRDCTFRNNFCQHATGKLAASSTFTASCGGGALYFVQCAARVEGCRFYGNRAYSSGGKIGGGAIFFGDADGAHGEGEDESLRLLVTNCLFAANSTFGGARESADIQRGIRLRTWLEDDNTLESTRSGGYGAAILACRYDIVDSTFVDNCGDAVQPYQEVFRQQYSLSIVRSLFWNNLSPYKKGQSSSYVKEKYENNVTDEDPQFERDLRPTNPAVANVGYTFPSAWGGQDLFVSASTGSDENTGAADQPLKTLTKALAVAADGAKITILDGLDAASETLPVRIAGRVGLEIAAVSGASATLTRPIDAAATRLAWVMGSTRLTLDGLTLSGGRMEGVNTSGGQPENYMLGVGLFVYSCGSVSLKNMTVADNVAAGAYEGYHRGIGCAAQCCASLSATDCIFKNNRSEKVNSTDGAGVRGAGLSAQMTKLVCERCTFSANRANAKRRTSAGTVYGVGLAVTSLFSGYDCQVRNCLFADNCAASGYIYNNSDVVYGYGASFDTAGVVENCTFADNMMLDEKPYGTGFRVLTSSANDPLELSVVNCVSYGQTKDISNAIGDYLSAQTNAFATVEGLEPADGDILLTASPFSGKSSQPYALANDSPLVDKGDNLGWTKKDHDLAGKSRLFGSRVDIGCYEYNKSGLMLILW